MGRRDRRAEEGGNCKVDAEKGRQVTHGRVSMKIGRVASVGKSVVRMMRMRMMGEYGLCRLKDPLGREPGRANESVGTWMQQSKHSP